MAEQSGERRTKAKIPRPVDDSDYYHTRAIEEQLAAQLATCDAARHRHEELATAYRFKDLMSRKAGHNFLAGDGANSEEVVTVTRRAKVRPGPPCSEPPHETASTEAAHPALCV